MSSPGSKFSPDEIKKAAAELSKRKETVVLTGAGISVASGVKPFRGKGGLWEKYDPYEVAHIDGFKKDPYKSWVALKEIIEVLGQAEPNAAHLCLAKMEQMGIVRSIITQNVDGLHQAAGSKVVIEFHGNTRKLICLECSSAFSDEEIDLGSLPPHCSYCHSILRPAAVFFGEAIPRDAMVQARSEAEQCSSVLVVGTSAIVEPAASLPFIAKRHGAPVIEINPESSPLTSEADYFLQGSAEEVLPRLLEGLISS